MNIQDTRRAIGLSQETLAYSAELSRSYLGKLENAKNSMSLDMLEKISGALGVDPSELVAPRSNRK